MKYSEAFNKLHLMSIDAKTTIEDFDAREPVELAARNIASFLGLLSLEDGAFMRGDALKCLGSLTMDEWDNIRFTMLGNIQLITGVDMEFKNKRIDWIRDLDTIFAMGNP